MASYLTRFDHFTVSESDDEEELIVTSENDEDFRVTFSIPEGLDLSDEEAVYKYIYMPARSAYRAYE